MVQPLFHGRWQFDHIIYQQVGLHASSSLDGAQPMLYGPHKPLPFQRRWPQLVNQQPHFLKRVLGGFTKLGQVTLRAFQVSSPDQSPSRFGKEGQAIK